MASMKLLKSILADDPFEDPKICKKKKKKSKKLKKEKLDKNKTRTKGQQWSKDDADYWESMPCTQMPVIKKRKKKKKNDDRLNEAFPLLLTQHTKINLSKQHKQLKGSSRPENKSAVQPGPCKQEPTLDKSLVVKDKARQKRKVMFKLSPEEILPKSQPCALTETFHSQLPSTYKLPSLNTGLSGDGSHCKLPVEENLESQNTSEDINSQDLFITQKTFSDPYADISSSLSTDEAPAVPPYQNSKQHRSPQEKPLCRQTAEASTQTENFFTSPGVATSLRFYLQNTAATCFEEPVDLSLPTRSRQDLGLRQWDIKPVEDQSHPELKVTDEMSSNESDMLLKNKAALSQLKVVQTRLNESFFFKLKGEAESPKPRSPLMVLTGCDKKLKK